MIDRSLHGMLIRGQIADEKSSLKRNMEKGKMSSNPLNHHDLVAVEPQLPDHGLCTVHSDSRPCMS